MKKTLFILLALLSVSAIPASSQVVNKTYNYNHEATNDRLRQQIGLDYSMPDYDTTSLDPNIIGVRLSKLLESLKKCYVQNEYNHLLSKIRDEQLTDRRAFSLRVDEMDVKSVSKKDSVITIKLNTVSIVSKKQKYSNDINLLFVNGVSEDRITNELFFQLGRYVK